MVIQHSLLLLKELSEIESKIEACQKLVREHELPLDLDELLIQSYLAQHNSTNG